MSVYVELDKKTLVLTITSGGAQVKMDTKLYPKAKEWITSLNTANLQDTSLENISKMKSIVWQLRETLKTRLNELPSRDPDYEVLEVNLQHINQANSYLFVALSAKSTADHPVFDELLIDNIECLN